MTRVKINSTFLLPWELIYIERDELDTNSGNSKEEVGITHIGSTYDTLCSSQIHDVNVVQKCYETLLSLNIIKYLSSGTELKIEKIRIL